MADQHEEFIQRNQLGGKVGNVPLTQAGAAACRPSVRDCNGVRPASRGCPCSGHPILTLALRHEKNPNKTDEQGPGTTTPSLERASMQSPANTDSDTPRQPPTPPDAAQAHDPERSLHHGAAAVGL